MKWPGEARRDEFHSFTDIPELVFDNPLGESTGVSVIFGATGGVMKAGKLSLACTM